ncbi:site-specific integrase [Sphingobacterium spiritivorum]|uniref:site-specific integrase n=1 Tax=Sphingobacterium spiritivorum TaxID=258 RepID=UPI003DA56A1A
MLKSQFSIEMFNFKTTLFFNQHAVNKKTGIVSVYIRVYISSTDKYEEDHFPIRIRWPHDKIDREACTLMPRYKNDPDANDYNMIIMTERNKYNEIAKLFRLSGKLLTMSGFQRELKFADPGKSLVRYMERRKEELFRLKEISLQTRKNYGSTIKSISEFKPETSFSDLSVYWIREYKAYLKKKKNSHNTIWTRIRDLKAFLRSAKDEVSIFVEDAVVNFPNKPIQSPTVYLDREELMRMIKLLNQCVLIDQDQNVLRAFLFQCFTSLRISDIYEANNKWMLSDSLMTFTMQKNRDKRPKTIRIPIIPVAKALVSEQLSTFFHLPTQQEYNRTLKQIAARCDISKNLSSHIGRHTFGYLFMTAVGDIFALKEIMGHSKITTTERYAHIDESYKLEQVLKMQKGFEILNNEYFKVAY